MIALYSSYDNFYKGSSFLFICKVTENEMTKYNGKCSCGQVHYTLKNDPIFTHACHCTLCQRYTASAFIVHSLMETSNFTLIKGSLSETAGPSGSGKGHVIKRCPNCGDQIYSHFMGLNNLLVLKTTTLNNANEMPPQAHVFLDSKLEWLKLNDDIPKFDKFYRREEIYSDESLKRMKIALQ